ncbi:uncharacterized protein LOC130010722, partial [Patella vulgata]|uniref:uncharacterized protein LOC130010722 n=1 Tax=Patella vulgata TaxID=6465 RepID=UPI0024A85BB1
SLSYDGMTSWQAFSSKFSRYALLQEWSDSESNDQLCFCLEGKAIVLRFCQGCIDKEAGQYACNMRPRTLDAAIQSIKWKFM